MVNPLRKRKWEWTESSVSGKSSRKGKSWPEACTESASPWEEGGGMRHRQCRHLKHIMGCVERKGQKNWKRKKKGHRVWQNTALLFRKWESTDACPSRSKPYSYLYLRWNLPRQHGGWIWRQSEVSRPVCAKLLQACLTLCDPMNYIACQAPLSIASLGKNTGVGCRVLLKGIVPTQGAEPLSLMSPALAGRFLATSATWEVPQTRIEDGYPQKISGLVLM